MADDVLSEMRAELDALTVLMRNGDTGAAKEHAARLRKLQRQLEHELDIASVDEDVDQRPSRPSIPMLAANIETRVASMQTFRAVREANRASMRSLGYIENPIDGTVRRNPFDGGSR